MMKKINFIIVTVFSFMLLVSSCYKEDKIIAEKGEPNHKIEDSSDPLDHYIYKVFKNTGVYLLYEYSENDFYWNMSGISSNLLQKQPDRDTLMMGISYLEKTLLSYYGDDFKRKYFPLKIMLARAVDNHQYESTLLDDRISNTGRNYLAVGKIRTGIDLLTDDQLLEAKGDINGMLWGNIIYWNNMLELPDDFFAPSLELYGISLSTDPDKATVDYVKKKGFWIYNKYSLANDFMLPDKAKDIYDFVNMITTHTTAEMMDLMKGFETLKVKYDALVGGLKDNYGIDLQAIGNAGIKK